MRACKYCNESLLDSNRSSCCTVCRNGMQRYGLNRVDQISLLESQGGTCAICYTPLVLFSGRDGGYIDHCHATNRVRGVLCHPCNTTIGYIENKHLDLKAIHYYLVP